MNKRRLVSRISIALVLCIVGGGVWLAARPAPGLVQGMADADSVNVSPKITARVLRFHVSEGDRVEAGQLLFDLDSPEVAAKERQITALLDAARAQESKADAGAREEEIRAAQANWKRAAAAAELAQSTAQRLQTLFAEGVVTRQRRDEADSQARSATQAEAAARAQYDQALAGARVQDRDAARAQVRQAEGALAEVAVSRDELLGRAPVAGEIGKRLADIGELVPAGHPVFTLVDIGHVWVAVYLREDQLSGVRIGKTLRGDVPALDAKAVPFDIYFINPAGDFATWRATRQSAGYDVKSFEVRARPSRPLAGFRPGMSVLFPWPQD